MTETPRYIDEKGNSTRHAKDMAKRLDYENTAQDRGSTLRNQLRAIVQSQLPPKNTLNWKDADNRYLVTKKDGHGLLTVLGRELPGSKLNDSKYAGLSYGFIFKKINETTAKTAANDKKWEVNWIEAGDKLYVKNGSVVVERKNGSNYGSFMVDIYPWDATPPATPAAPAEPAPNTIEVKLGELDKETDPTKIKDGILTILKDFAKQQGIKMVSPWDDQEYNWSYVRVNLPRIMNGVKQACKDYETKRMLEQVPIILGESGRYDDEDAGLRNDSARSKVFVIDWNESPDTIANDLKTSAEKLLARYDTEEALGSLNSTIGSNYRLVSNIDYDYAEITANSEKLKQAYEYVVQIKPALKDKLATTPVYLKSGSHSVFLANRNGVNVYGQYIWTDYRDSVEFIGAHIAHNLEVLYPDVTPQ